MKLNFFFLIIVFLILIIAQMHDCIHSAKRQHTKVHVPVIKSFITCTTSDNTASAHLQKKGAAMKLQFSPALAPGGRLRGG